MAWVLIYGGIAVACVGFALARQAGRLRVGRRSPPAASPLAIRRLFCIWLRSRLRDARADSR